MRKLKKQKTKRNQPFGEDFVDLRKVLPPTVMRTMIEKMSIEEHALLRAVCRYAHDEIESYWRTQKTFEIAQLFTWFPHLSDWNLTSLAGIQNEIFAAFNLIKSGNLRKLSLRRLRNVSIKGLVTCIEMATGEPASTFLRNVVELDIRGCLIPPCHIKMFDELFPNLQSIILGPDTIIAAKNRKLTTKSITEITHHINISSEVKFTENENVPAADMHTAAFIREHLPDVRHIFIDLDS